MKPYICVKGKQLAYGIQNEIKPIRNLPPGEHTIIQENCAFVMVLVIHNDNVRKFFVEVEGDEWVLIENMQVYKLSVLEKIVKFLSSKETA